MRNVLIASILFSSPLVHAAALEACGELQSASGDKCENLVVMMNVSKCGDGKDAVPAKIQCKEQEAIATFHGALKNYRAVLVKSGSGWGKGSFELKGKIWSHLRLIPKPATAVSKREEPVPTKTVATPATPVAGAEANREPANAQLIRPETAHAEKSADTAATPEAAKTAAVPPATAAPPTPAKPKDEDLVNLVSLFSGWSAKGSADGYYSYNFNGAPRIGATPTSANLQAQNKYHVFDMYNNDLQLSYAHIQIQKVTGKVTTTLDFAYGPAAQAIAGTKTDTAQINLKQAIVGYKVTDQLNVEAGKFVTYLGYETIEAQDNWNYSRGVLFGYFVPFWHQGVKATYTFNDKFAAMITVNDGWNNSYDQNGQKAFGGEFAWTPNDKTALYFNVITGQDNMPSNINSETPLATRTVYDFVATLKATPKLSFALNADYYSQSHFKAWGVAGYARYQFDEQWALSPRVEYIQDKDNLALGESLSNGQMFSTYTLTLEDKLSSNFALRLEGRVDKSSQQIFLKQGTPEASQTLGLLGFMASF